MQTLGVKELRVQFFFEDEQLVEAIGLAKRTIEILKEEVARCTESSAVGKKELEDKMDMLKARIDHRGRIRDRLNAAVSERSHDRDEETKAKLHERIKLVRTITKDLRTWPETHPKLDLFAGLTGGSVVGAALYQKHFNATPPSPDAAEAQHREKIEAMLKALENNSLTAQDITVLRDAYQQMFAPARMPSGPHECLVCHEELRSCDHDDGDHVHSDQCAVSARGCNHHFAHRACYTEWAMLSGRKECMVCSSAR